MNLMSNTTALRRLSASDLRSFQAYRNDPVIARYQSWERMDDVAAVNFLNHMSRVAPLMRPGHWTQIAVTETSTNAMIGDMGLRLSENGGAAEMGITLARAAHGQGHATRAMQLAAQLLFDITDITRIHAWADTRNTASRALVLRAGFTEAGIEERDGITEAMFVMRRPTH